MELQLVSEDIEIEVQGVKFAFPPASPQDEIFAFSLVNNTRGHATPIDKGVAVQHVFERLKAFEGELKAGEEVLDVKRLKELATKIKGKFTSTVALAWALRVVQQHGYLDPEAEEKKDEASA